MATSSGILSALKVILPRMRGNGTGTGQTDTYNPSSRDTVLTVPTYRNHLTDLYTTRAASDSRTLMKELFQFDPDTSGAMNAFLTVADTHPVMVVRDANRQIDRAGQATLMQLLTALTNRTDYSKGFRVINSLSAIAEACRYMVLMRGGIAGELILSKAFTPYEIRMVDLASVEWYEPTPGAYRPIQRTKDGAEVSLDIPTFFTTWFRKDPTTIYSNSYFVSSINTIAARQQVINDLYRIMQLTGYPRMKVGVLEEVILNGAQPDEKNTPEKRRQYIERAVGGITTMVSNIRADQTFVHTDAMEVSMLNEKSPGMSLDISKVIDTLNQQNQAGMKVMGTILGRGTAGVNTASVEARIFALNAEALNEPVADFLSQALTLALRMTGSESYVEVYFQPVELRSPLELETNLVVRSTRLKNDLSLGLITDDEYHLWMYGRLAPEGSPTMSGTQFATPAANVKTDEISPNNDPLGRSIAPEGGTGGARDNKSKQ